MNLKSLKKKINIFLIILMIMFAVPIASNATENLSDTKIIEKIAEKTEEQSDEQSKGIDFDADELKEIYGKQDSEYNKIGSKVIGIAQFICYTAAVIVLLYKGVQFMYKSPEAKAELKKELVSYAVGAGILFSIGTIIRIIGNISFKMF